MTDPELDKLEHDHLYYGPSGVTQVIIKKSELYDLIRCNRMFNAMRESMREFRGGGDEKETQEG